MGRPQKNTVDYFPHDCNCDSKSTMYVIQKKYGNDGYATWFKILESLGSNDGHKIDCNKQQMWEFLQAKTGVTENKLLEILNTLSVLEAIDSKLWEHKIIWSDNFIERIKSVYDKRKIPVPLKPIFNNGQNQQDISDTETPKIDANKDISDTETPKKDILQQDISDTETPNSDTETPQSKVKYSKEDKIKIDNINNTIMQKYNEICISLPKVIKITTEREKHIKARLDELGDIERFIDFLKIVENSDFLTGRNKVWDKCDFDWIIKPSNFTKILEGKYNNKKENTVEQPKQSIKSFTTLAEAKREDELRWSKRD